MEGDTLLVIIAVAMLAAAAVSRRIQGTIITLPMLYVFLGLLLGSQVMGVLDVNAENEFVRIIAELTLVLVLSSDAARIDIRRLRNEHTLPLRLLGIGLPLTMIIGAIVAWLLFPQVIFWEAAVLAIVLAPTDASLGQAVVNNLRVPVRIRQSLNIESGLNDGIAAPFLLLALSLAEAAEQPAGLGYWLGLAARQIGVGALAGAGVGFLGGHFLTWGHRSGWMSSEYRKISSIVIALLGYGLAEMLGGNGFIAAFFLGVTMANTTSKKELKPLNEHVETEVQLLMMLTFMLVFGAVMLPAVISQFSWRMLLYAVLSLAVVRLVSVGISLLGSKVRPVTVIFLGWFGPRGVASILYIFVVLEDNLQNESLIYNVVMLTVLLSIFAHGITAAPASKWYSKRVEMHMDENSPEMKVVEEMPLRGSGMI